MESRTSRAITGLRNSSPGFRRSVGAMLVLSGAIPILAPSVANANTSKLILRNTCATATSGPANVYLNNNTDKDIPVTLKFVVGDKLVAAMPPKTFTASAHDETTTRVTDEYEDKTVVAVESNGDQTNPITINCVKDVEASSTTSTTRNSITTVNSTTSTISPVTSVSTTRTSLVTATTTTTISPDMLRPMTTIDTSPLTVPSKIQDAQPGSAAANAVTMTRDFTG